MVARRTVPERQRGVAVIELALAAPIFIIVLFGIVEFGLIMYSKGVITNASREGARLGVVLSSPRKNQAEIDAKVRDYLQKSGFLDPVTITVTGAGGSGSTPLSVQVDYSYTFQVLPNFIQSLTGSLNLSAETMMLME